MESFTNIGDIFFALDIGTRSVIGVIGKKVEDKVLILDASYRLHKKRAMYDGQVHDIDRVALVVKEVKEELEERNSIKLTNVSLAAAGRSLKTVKTKSEETFEKEQYIDLKTIKDMELGCLEEAKKILSEKEIENKDGYFNVGHTITLCKVDDYEIKNPLDHRGTKLYIEMISTFLPKIVVEALESVMKKVDLEISYLTLEPIVAMEAVIPENIRLLNIAMVDIGAGTSDIAISNNGSIIGYEMTSTAGDEITEKISKEFLLDFDNAEKLKCNLFKEEQQVFKDIIGIENKVSTKDILDRIKDAIKLVADNISEAILKCNEKAPSAVFLIGGGSQIPLIRKFISEKLKIREERIAIKNVNERQDIVNKVDILKGPDSVTPIGILLCAVENEKKNFINVFVNEKEVKLFKSNDLKVSDALIMGGFNPRLLVSKKGESVVLTVNGKRRIFSGEYGKEAIIFLNGENTNIDARISDYDIIKVTPSTKGNDAVVYVKDVFEKKFLYINDDVIPFIYKVYINGEEEKNFDRKLEKYDEVIYEYLDNTSKLKDFLSIPEDEEIMVNSEITDENITLNCDDRIYIGKQLIEEKENESLENEPIVKENEKEEIKETKKEKELKKINVICNGENVTIESQKEEIVFIDIFDFIDFDRATSKGNLVLKLNGENAQYLQPLKENDTIEIYWS